MLASTFVGILRKQLYIYPDIECEAVLRKRSGSLCPWSHDMVGLMKQKMVPDRIWRNPDPFPHQWLPQLVTLKDM